MLKKLLSTTIILACISFSGFAQELNCKVKVMRDAIQGIDKEVFIAMERNILEFLNNRKWTSDQFQNNERIDCNILINLTKQLDQDVFQGTINIQASRPVFNASYTTSIVNHIDKEFAFRFNQFTPLQFDDNRVAGNDPLASNLTATLAYYVYIILGLDYESFAPNAGNDLFKRAQNVVNNAPESGKTIVGWRAVDGNKNRYWIIDQILNPRFKEFRTVWYTMHREGLDKMYNKPEESRKLILEALPKFVQLNRENPSSMLLQFFFSAKSDEFAGLVSQEDAAQKTQYISMLQQIDVPNIQKYNSIK
ncbi:hypothetical protein CAP35_00605 [Chitinophagaceae bacterium IBVUCB1]|nr:hypothetical protein CAP35_00605 [Chitinophagaceae bacterium IBVUCB1]